MPLPKLVILILGTLLANSALGDSDFYYALFESNQQTTVIRGFGNGDPVQYLLSKTDLRIPDLRIEQKCDNLGTKATGGDVTFKSPFTSTRAPKFSWYIYCQGERLCHKEGERILCKRVPRTAFSQLEDSSHPTNNHMPSDSNSLSVAGGQLPPPYYYRPFTTIKSPPDPFRISGYGSEIPFEYLLRITDIKRPNANIDAQCEFDMKGGDIIFKGYGSRPDYSWSFTCLDGRLCRNKGRAISCERDVSMARSGVGQRPLSTNNHRPLNFNPSSSTIEQSLGSYQYQYFPDNDKIFKVHGIGNGFPAVEILRVTDLQGQDIDVTQECSNVDPKEGIITITINEPDWHTHPVAKWRIVCLDGSKCHKAHEEPKDIFCKKIPTTVGGQHLPFNSNPPSSSRHQPISNHNLPSTSNPSSFTTIQPDDTYYYWPFTLTNPHRFKHIRGYGNRFPALQIQQFMNVRRFYITQSCNEKKTGGEITFNMFEKPSWHVICVNNKKCFQESSYPFHITCK